MLSHDFLQYNMGKKFPLEPNHPIHFGVPRRGRLRIRIVMLFFLFPFAMARANTHVVMNGEAKYAVTLLSM